MLIKAIQVNVTTGDVTDFFMNSLSSAADLEVTEGDSILLVAHFLEQDANGDDVDMDLRNPTDMRCILRSTRALTGTKWLLQTSYNPNTTAGITAQADNGAGGTTMTSANHELQEGWSVVVSGTTNYDGTYTISNVTTNTFDCAVTYVSDEGTGTWIHYLWEGSDLETGYVSWLVVLGAETTGSMTAQADGGGGTTTCTSAGHNLATGDYVEINGTTDYNGRWEITYVDANNFKITTPFVADEATGDWRAGALIDSMGASSETYVEGWVEFDWTDVNTYAQTLGQVPIRINDQLDDGGSGLVLTPGTTYLTTGTGVVKTLWDANTIVKADSDDTPVAMTVNANTLVGRAGGSIASLAMQSVWDDVLDVNSLVNKAAPIGADLVPIYDSVGGDHKQASITGVVSGIGALLGPASTTDNAIVRMDGVGGSQTQGYSSNDPTISDAGLAVFAGGIDSSPIGAGGASTGAFTTLGATGVATVGELIVSQAAAAAEIELRRPAGQSGIVWYRTVSSGRWYHGVNADAEGGANAGSDWVMSRRDDAGAHLGYALWARRDTGYVGINAPSAAAVTASLWARGDTADGSTNVFRLEDSAGAALAVVNTDGDMDLTRQLTIADSATIPPLNLTERAAAPSSPAAGDIYLDDGTNTASTAPGWRRYTGAAWEDMGALTGALDINGLAAETAPDHSADYVAIYDGSAAANRKMLLQYIVPEHIIFAHQEAAGTDGAGITNGADRTRTVNTTIRDDTGAAGLAANVMNVPAGEYVVTVSCCHYSVDSFVCWLENTTDGTEHAEATSMANTSNGDGAWTTAKDYLSIAAAKNFELQTQVTTTNAVNGEGLNSNFGHVEGYAYIHFARIRR